MLAILAAIDIETIRKLYEGVLAIYAVASTIAALTPTDKDDHVMDRIGNILRKIGMLRPPGPPPGPPPLPPMPPPPPYYGEPSDEQ